MTHAETRTPDEPGRDEIAVRIRGVSKRFGEKHVYDRFDLDVRRGEVLTILGPSGTGKSVLLKMLIGLHKPDTGQIFIDGVDIVPLPERELRGVRKKVGMLFQGAALFDSMSVGENVAYGLREYTDWPEVKIKARVAECLAAVGLPGIEKQRPSSLSGGMQKRVGLARALAPGPEMMLYDEPSTGLDPANSKRIRELILSVQKQLSATSIVITHNLGLAQHISDRVALVSKGRLLLITDGDAVRKDPPPQLAAFMRGEDLEQSS